MITDNNVNDFDGSDSDVKVDNGNEMIMVVMAKAMVMLITKNPSKSDWMTPRQVPNQRARCIDDKTH